MDLLELLARHPQGQQTLKNLSLYFFLLHYLLNPRPSKWKSTQTTTLPASSPTAKSLAIPLMVVVSQSVMMSLVTSRKVAPIIEMSVGLAQLSS